MKKIVARFEVAEVKLSKDRNAIVRLEPVMPPEGFDATDEAAIEAFDAENAQFGPTGDALVLGGFADDELRPGQIVRLTLEIESDRDG